MKLSVFNGCFDFDIQNINKISNITEHKIPDNTIMSTIKSAWSLTELDFNFVCMPKHWLILVQSHQMKMTDTLFPNSVWIWVF